MDHRTALAQRFRDFEQHGAARARLYARLARSIADDPEVLALLDEAPDEQRLPVLLFAAVHLLVIEGHGGDLARFYPTLHGSDAAIDPSADDPYPAFREVALEHAGRVRHLTATRQTQTNEIGRCALFLPALAAVAAETGPVSLVDVGASAGLNLLLPQYGFDYGERGAIAGPSPIVLPCGLRGHPPAGFDTPSHVPPVADAVGIDMMPIDVTDDDAVRWLQACVWPDMTDRFERLVEAIGIARAHPPRVHTGDAVEGVRALVESSSRLGHPVVLTSWVLNYLPIARQREFVAQLDRLGSDIDLSWVIAESPAETPGIPVPTHEPAEALTVVALVRWRRGTRTVTRLGTAHPHGYWLHWG